MAGSHTLNRQSLASIFLRNDDGPTKTVTESSAVTIDLAKLEFTILSKAAERAETYRIDEATSAPGGRILLKLSGPGQENGHAVDVRITVTIHRNHYSLTKETRLAGKEFEFRDGYSFTRRDPPSAK
jgi:hypothetical protein